MTQSRSSHGAAPAVGDWTVTKGGEDFRQLLEGLEMTPAELDELAAAIEARHPTAIRRRRGVDRSRWPYAVEPVPWYRLADRVSDPAARPSRSLSYAAADFYLQDAGSLLALAACGADTTVATKNGFGPGGPLVCDLCASPGGKATALVEALGDTGLVLANEPVKARLPPLILNLARTGSDRYAVSSLDPDRLADTLTGVFDLVLVDAPCSGQALLSRGKQTRSAWSSQQVEHSAARQRRILAAATRLLRPGGTLVYSTCTFAVAENEAHVEWLTETSAARPWPVPALRAYASPRSPASYRLWPHRHATAGAFAARMVLEASPPSASPEGIGSMAEAAPEPRRGASRRRKKRPRRDVPRGELPDLNRWFERLGQTRLQVIGQTLIGWPAEVADWVEAVAVAGPELAHRTGRTWKPAHAAALRRTERAVAEGRWEIDSERAYRFVAGEPIDCSARGWHRVLLQGRPLGWIKGDGRIGKNHLPAAARLQCDHP